MKKQSPCLGCIRVEKPEACDNKRCAVWRQWFLARWKGIHSYYRQMAAQKKGETDELESGSYGKAV